ncbi:MAG TPA: CocE/NonD family hydrolase, partial [Candidatus Binataceae bacterium]|nr:CocE/NonD family hydrolase [Candidatus Binataceae bacterium]
FELGWMLTYFAFMARNTLARKGLSDREGPILDSYLARRDIPIAPFNDAAFRHLPISDWGERLAKGAPYFADYLHHWKDGAYWNETDLRSRCDTVAAPVLHVGSWYDAFQYDTLAMYTAMRDGAATSEARRGQRLIMGPWAHLMPYSVPTSRGTGEIDFGAEAKIELHAIQLRWFDQQLKGIDTGMLEEPPVRIFVMGENRWRDESEWPLARTIYTKVFLHSRGSANSLAGDGSLSLAPPGGEETADRYNYDPVDPVPTRGGTTLGLPPGVFDQTRIEQRADVLVYTGEPLSEALEVTGPVSMKLFAASSAPDTDFMAKLIDVRPDGYAHNLAEGAVRARFRNSLSEPTLITPGKIYQYDIDMWSTSHVFKAGHRVRLEITSSNFPRYDRNPNTGHDFGADNELRIAQQNVFHSASNASYLILPVIPR